MQGKKELIKFRIASRHKEKIKKFAEQEGKTLSDYIRSKILK